MTKDILRCLSFGVKKPKKATESVTLESGVALRMRVVPDNMRRELIDLRKMEDEGMDTYEEKVPDQPESQESDEIELFAGQKFVDAKKTSEPQPQSKKKNKRTHVVDPNETEIQKEIRLRVTELRRANRIFTFGESIPDPIIDFDDLGLPEQLSQSLREFGILEPTPIQMQAIPLMNQKRDILCSAPTGSGKTLAFVIPVILEVLRVRESCKTPSDRKLVSILLEPTTELAAQTFRQFLKYSQGIDVKCALFDSATVPGDVDVLVSTPNRLVHHIKEMDVKQLQWLVVDESDRLFDVTEGPDRCFRSQLAAIYRACDNDFTRRAFFSATFSNDVEKWCSVNLNDVAMLVIGSRNSANRDVTQELVFSGSEHGKVVAIRQLFSQAFDPPALVFVQSKERAREVAAALTSVMPSSRVNFISGEKSVEEREKVLDSFRAGSLWVLVCTELIGRGIDLRNVNLVVNFDLPTSIISYIHRVGRTGRAGRKGRAVTYFTEGDTAFLRPIATIIHQAGFEVPAYTLALPKVSRNTKKDLLKHAPKRKHVAVLRKKHGAERKNKPDSAKDKDTSKPEATGHKVKSGKVSKKTKQAPVVTNHSKKSKKKN